ncbi:Receptor-type tyrosine-protein phosphatase T [Aphelenchoides besseyi]|nr:Receptor-type tyrosine-protein phosphatase T [Aphelenchoides besseyi]
MARRPGSSASKESLTNSGKRKKTTEDVGSDQRGVTSRSFLGRSFERIFRRKKPNMQLPTEANSGREETTAATAGRVAPKVEKAMTNYVQEMLKIGLARLKADWLEVAAHMPEAVTSILYDHNTNKNFPGGQPCLDITRVGLTFGVPPATEYIHANWIQSRHCALGLRIIIGQAPMDSTVDDFWRCVWQERIRSVVMLCEKYENNNRVCAQYWPQRFGENKLFGGVRVEYMEDQPTESERWYTKMRMSVSFGSERSLDTFIYQFKGWPPAGVPENVRSVLRIVREVSDSGQTAFIHGAAGVGRAGVFTAILICQRVIIQGETLSVIDVVREIREQRLSAIATEIQYLFIHRALLEYIRAKNVMPTLCRQIIGHLDNYHRDYAAAGHQPVPVPTNHTFSAKPLLPARRNSKEEVHNRPVMPVADPKPPVAVKPPIPAMFGSASPIQQPATKPTHSSSSNQPGAEYEPLNIGTPPPPPPK